MGELMVPARSVQTSHILRREVGMCVDIGVAVTVGERRESEKWERDSGPRGTDSDWGSGDWRAVREGEGRGEGRQARVTDTI